MTEPKANGLAEAVEELAGAKLGVEQWDRPAIYRETAAAALDDTLPYWLVLGLSAAIATLGLALDSSAVVIGAMLVAPLLAPIMGLALALAMGDARLAMQTGAIVAASVLLVVLLAALLTLSLPFHAITLEISARARPTTLDMVIAVCSGLVGAVVTVARGSRLSAAVPGVAISVALIPPLAVAGFGIGAGEGRDLVYGSLLLFGANLAGIVLSGVVVFLLVGMHRHGMVEEARRWHSEREVSGLASWIDRLPGVQRIGVFSSPGSRVGMVVLFTVALGVPLSETLAEMARETRVEGAVQTAADSIFDEADRSSIINRQVVYGSGRTQVYLRVATTRWFGQPDRERFERIASERAGEPVRLSLEQLPARGEDIAQLAALIPGATSRPVRPPPPPGPTGIGDLLVDARMRLQQAMDVIALPNGMRIAGMELGTTDAGDSHLRMVYASLDSLNGQARQMLERQITRSLDVPELVVQLDHVSTEPRSLAGTAADAAVIDELAEIAGDHERLRIEILSPGGADEAARRVVQRLVDRELPRERMLIVPTPGAGLQLRLAVPDPEEDAPESGPPPDSEDPRMR